MADYPEDQVRTHDIVGPAGQSLDARAGFMGGQAPPNTRLITDPDFYFVEQVVCHSVMLRLNDTFVVFLKPRPSRATVD